MKSISAQIKRQFRLWHRWFGIVLMLPIALWFLSGAVMLYVPYPSLLESERRVGLQDLDLGQVRTTPEQAARAAGIDGIPARARLGMLGPRPVWRLHDEAGRAFVVDAVDLAPVGAVDRRTAEALGRDFQARSSGRAVISTWHDGPIDYDQWTINGGHSLQPPLHRLRFDDSRVLYVSQVTGEVVRDASAKERGWGWIGAVLHWVYVTPLRRNGPLWTQVVLWLSGLSLVVAVSGFGIGLWRSWDAWRRSRRWVPFRGWHAWHHWLGLAGGVLVLTWLFSGFLSMRPFDTPGNPVADAWRGAWSQQPVRWPLGWRAPAPGQAFPADLIEVELRWLDSQPWYRYLHRDGSIHWQGAVHGLPPAPDIAALIERAADAGGAQVLDREWLEAGDLYYVRHPHSDPLVLPAWRLRLDDAAGTRIYLSPARADIVAIEDRSKRMDRWLYSALHSWDLPWLLHHPLLRQLLLLLGLGVGFALTTTGFVIGWRRLGATFRR